MNQIGEAISISWQSALETDNYESWQRIQDMLFGMTHLAIRCHCQEDALSDLEFLRDIVAAHIARTI